MTALWLVVAAALLTARPPRAAQSRHRRVPGSRPARPGVLSAVAAVAVGVTGPLLLGPSRGLVAAVILAPTTWLLVRQLQARVRLTRDPQLPLVLDVLAAVLRAGRPLAPALLDVADGLGGRSAEVLARVAVLLDLGAAPQDAWTVVGADPELRSVARTAGRSAESGIRLAAGFEALAAELRADARAAAEARAHRAGVLAMGPLGLCFLPAFVCLGVVPVVIGIAHDVLGGLS